MAGLSMPWLKFWVRDKEGGADELDGRIRVNSEQWDGKLNLAVPRFLSADLDDLALGPYSPEVGGSKS
jgi:hypothetical protein